MKTIGLLGGMTWESTATYYELINRRIAHERGGVNSARIVMHSVNLRDIRDLTDEGRWDEAGELLAKAGHGLKMAGADFLVLCVNTMHKVADVIEQGAGLPLLHVVDAVVEEIGAAKVHTVGLLGTRFVVEEDFYKGRLLSHGLNVIVPGTDDCAFVHHSIREELAQGIFRDETRARCSAITKTLADQGAQGVVLACTELPLLMSEHDSAVPVFSTTLIHAEAAAKRAMS